MWKGIFFNISLDFSENNSWLLIKNVNINQAHDIYECVQFGASECKCSFIRELFVPGGGIHSESPYNYSYSLGS